MSRSYKKHPRVKDASNKGMKKFANKKVRHTKNIPNGKAYKKKFLSPGKYLIGIGYGRGRRL